MSLQKFVQVAVRCARPLEVAITDNDGVPTKTPLVLLWAFFTLWWSIFTPPHKTFAARVLLFQPLWGVRMYLRDATWVQDVALALSLHAVYSYWTGAWRFSTLDDFKRIDLNDHVLRLYIHTFSLLGVCGALAGGIVHRGHKIKDSDKSEPSHEPRIDEQLLPPLLITSRTTHSRFFPQKHVFSYSYLFVGIPVGIRGRVSSALSIDSQKRSWFHVSSADYLARGHNQLGLGDKLKHYLHTQGVTDRDYAFAYLVTAPRFLGYSFNPVSFWYLYDADTALKYIVIEVNNTFDERRMYLLKAGSTNNDSGVDLSTPSDGGSDGTPKKTVFTETFDKDFHVSPFNSRKGSYSLRATDPLAAYQETGQVQLDNTVVLRSSRESPKIVARVWSEGAPVEASHISQLQLVRFIAAWWWVGLATFPRIVWEAQKLFFRKKLHVWYRPEVVGTSVGRAHTNDEKQLEAFFRNFLTHVVEQCESSLRVIYEPAHHNGEEIVLYSPCFTYEEDRQRTLTLQVLSPAFYSRFVHYAHAREAFDRECLATDEKNRTVVIRNPSLLPVLLEWMQNERKLTQPEQTSLDQMQWALLRRLRCPPSNPSYPNSTNSGPEYDVTDIRTFCHSELDEFVQQHFEDAGAYRKIVTKLFLAQRFSLGSPALITFVDWLVRGIILLAAMYYCDHSTAVDVLRPRDVRSEDMWTIAATLILANGVHIWSLAKG